MANLTTASIALVGLITIVNGCGGTDSAPDSATPDGGLAVEAGRADGPATGLDTALDQLPDRPLLEDAPIAEAAVDAADWDAAIDVSADVPIVVDSPAMEVAIEAGSSIPDRLRNGFAEVNTAARPGYGTLAVRRAGERLAFLEVQANADGSFRRRVRAGTFSYGEAAGEIVHDLALHPSGEITLAVERTDVESAGYQLVRLDATLTPITRAVLPVGETLPAEDRASNLPSPPWRLRSRENYPLLEGWMRLAALGEDVACVFLSLVGDGSNDLVSGIARLRWTDSSYQEVFTRLVDGRHTGAAPAWQYDELRFADALLRPLVTVDETDGTLLAGRTWTQSRCKSVRQQWGGFDANDCGLRATSNGDSREHAFAFTSFSPTGERLATRSFMPEKPYFFTLFGFAARGGQVALVGTTSVQEDDGTVAFYDGDRVPFDGLVALVDRSSGALVWERHLDLGRADLLSAVRWPAEGIVAAGISDWDRWNGGMSISRPGVPWLVYVEPATGTATPRTLARRHADRHSHFLDLEVLPSGPIVAVGLDDAPMTHSGDGGHDEAMTFGGLAVTWGDSH